MKFETFLDKVPGSNLSSTSKMGIQAEPLTHACQIRIKTVTEIMPQKHVNITNSHDMIEVHLQLKHTRETRLH